MNFDFLGFGADKAQLLVAGALGGLVRWLTLRDHWSDGLISIAVGAICSVFVAPGALPALAPVLGNMGMPAESVSGLSGFLIGVGGITVSGFFIDAWRLRRRLLKQEKASAEGEAGSNHDGDRK